jgi:hypothetical protein
MIAMKTMKHLFILYFILIACSVNGQITQGRVIYDITYPDFGGDSLILGLLPHKCTAYFNTSNFRMDFNSVAGIKSRILVDNENQVAHFLLNNNGSKSDFIMPIEKQADSDKQTYYNETDTAKKMIAGYSCSATKVKAQDGTFYSVWYTKEIALDNGSWNNQFKSIEGFMMEFTFQESGTTLIMKAGQVIPEVLAADTFLIPEGYNVISEDKFRQMMKGR